MKVYTLLLSSDLLGDEDHLKCPYVSYSKDYILDLMKSLNSGRIKYLTDIVSFNASEKDIKKSTRNGFSVFTGEVPWDEFNLETLNQSDRLY
jgi:hypothetical protein